ncbi:MAG: hypothetical protein AB1765_01060 [Candidatus Hydrogenedentota bacterium]
MASVKEKVYAEMENITKVLSEIEKVKDIPFKQLVVIVGIGGYLQNAYTGMENILKQLLSHKNIPIPDTPTWHRDLLSLSVEHNFISREIADKIDEYRVFRHFFTHAYGFLIEWEKLKPLMDHISEVYSKFKREIDRYLEVIPEIKN